MVSRGPELSEGVEVMLGKPKHLGRWLAIAVAIGLGCLGEAWAAKPVKPPPPPDPVTYTLVELSDSEGYVRDINQLDGGVEVVGILHDNSGEAEVRRAHYWMVDAAGHVLLSLDLQTLPPVPPDAIVHSSAEDVNNQGVVVGYQVDQTDVLGIRPVLWATGASAPFELPLPEGASGAMAMSINDEGIVVGTARSLDTESLVAWKVTVVNGVWTVQDTQKILIAPGLLAAQVVNSGYVCTSVAADPAYPTSYRAYRLKLAWDGEQVWEVAGSRTQLFNIYSQAQGINEAGTVCGSYNDGRSWAFVMNAAGTLLVLPQLPGGRIGGQAYEIRNFAANGLNNASPLQVVGRGSIVITKTLEWRGDVGVLWNIGGSAVNLDTATSRDLYLNDINDAGWIVGDAEDTEDFLLRQPVVLIPSR